MIEAHVLRALRTMHEVRLEYIREAVQIDEAGLGIQRLLVGSELQRIEFDVDDLPVEFSSFGQLPESDQRKLISPSPFVSLGRSVIRSRGISTRVIAERLDVGESAEDFMADYDPSEDEIEEAGLYEAAA